MWLKRFLLSVTSLLLSLFFLLGSAELFLQWNNLPKEKPYSAWTLSLTTYTPRYIFWLFRKGVDGPEKSLVTDPETFCFSGQEDTKPIRVLFLGDSHTSAFIAGPQQDYASIFAQKWVRNSHTCVTVMRLATGGVGNSQELAIFEDTLTAFQPDVVLWQFFSNDFYNNVQLSVHTLEEETLNRRLAWRNLLFWSGWLQQTIPILSHMRVGQALQLWGEKRDPLGGWPTNPNQWEEMAQYNRRLIPALLRRMGELGQENNFEFFTLLAPHECEVRSEVSCGSNQKIEYQQSLLRELLTLDGRYLPTEASDSGELSPTQAEKLFTETEPVTVAGRHLSVEGNAFFGQKVFDAFYPRAEDVGVVERFNTTQ